MSINPNEFVDYDDPYMDSDEEELSDEEIREIEDERAYDQAEDNAAYLEDLYG